MAIRPYTFAIVMSYHPLSYSLSLTRERESVLLKRTVWTGRASLRSGSFD